MRGINADMGRKDFFETGSNNFYSKRDPESRGLEDFLDSGFRRSDEFRSFLRQYQI